MSARTVVQAKASVLLALGMSLLFPLALSLLYGDASWPSFLVPALIMAFVGGAGMLATRASSSRSGEYVSNRDVYLSVTLAWVLAALRGGVPVLVNGTFDSFLDSRGGCLRGSAKGSPATGESSYCKSDALH